MRISRLILIGLLTGAICYSSEEVVTLSPFEVPGANGYRPEALEQKIKHLAEDWKVAHPKAADDAELSFLVFIEPALFPKTSFCVFGSLNKLDSKQSVCGDLTIKRVNGDGMQDQHLKLTQAQAGEVYGWFRDSGYLNPKEKNALPPSVLDGVSIWIEISSNDKLLQFYRNAYDNTNSERFFCRVKALEIWCRPLK